MSKAIPNFNGYSITEDGIVYSSRRSGSKGGLRALHTDKAGYKRVTLTKDGKQYNRLVHQLVAETFIGPRQDGLFVCHKDGDKSNNHVSNLYYGTRSDNAKDAVIHGTHNFLQDGFDDLRPSGEGCTWSKLDEDKVRYIKSMKGERTCRELAAELNVAYSNISAIWCGRSWGNVA
jgi:hypothetical protein